MIPTLYLTSDLHLPTGPFEWPKAALDADVVLVAGDLGTGDEFYFDKLIELDKPVVFVPGNHDFWTKDPNRTVEQILTEMRQKTEGTQVRVLYNSYCDILGVRFIGATLWSSLGDLNENLVRAAVRVARDYRYINVTPRDTEGNGGLTPDIAHQWHQEARAFIDEALSASPLPAVVLTHMAPSYRSLEGHVAEQALLPENWASRGLSAQELARVALYASDLEDLITERSPLVWAHGHVHRRMDYPVGNTRVMANPRGYYQGPLTAADIDRYRFLGFSLSAKDIDESQARFKAYPYWGDAVGFEPELRINLAAGLSPTFEQGLPTLIANLAELLVECEERLPHLGHADRVIQESVQESFTRRAEQFDEQLKGFLTPMVAAWASSLYPAHLTDVGTQLRILGFESFGEVTPWFDARYESPKKTGTSTLRRMRALIKVLPMVCQAPMRAQKRARRAIKAVQRELRAKGIRFAVRGWVTAPYVRDVPLHHGAIYLDVAAPQIRALEVGLDELINPTRPRQLHFDFRCVADAADWGETL